MDNLDLDENMSIGLNFANVLHQRATSITVGRRSMPTSKKPYVHIIMDCIIEAISTNSNKNV
jgi:hypothetical protein